MDLKDRLEELEKEEQQLQKEYRMTWNDLKSVRKYDYEITLLIYQLEEKYLKHEKEKLMAELMSFDHPNHAGRKENDS